MLEWVKQIFSNWGLAKDAMQNPGETGGEVAQSIIERLNPAFQRIVVLVLIIIAMVMGANIGIDYQKQQAISNPPAIEMTPPDYEEIPANPKLPPAEPIKAQEVWKPAPEPLTLPEASTPNFTQPRQATKPDRGKAVSSARGGTVQAKKKPAGVRRPVRPHQGHRKPDNYSVWQSLPKRELSSSGPGGY